MATAYANEFREGHREGLNHQRNQDRRAKQDLDKRQAQMQQDMDSNYGMIIFLSNLVKIKGIRG